MSWANVPAATQSFLLHMHDMDLARNKTTDDQAHWVLWNIPATLGAACPKAYQKDRHCPTGVIQISATGPHVPWSEPRRKRFPFHHYVFELYALDTNWTSNHPAMRSRRVPT